MVGLHIKPIQMPALKMKSLIFREIREHSQGHTWISELTHEAQLLTTVILPNTRDYVTACQKDSKVSLQCNFSCVLTFIPFGGSKRNQSWEYCQPRTYRRISVSIHDLVCPEGLVICRISEEISPWPPGERALDAFRPTLPANTTSTWLQSQPSARFQA